MRLRFWVGCLFRHFRNLESFVGIFGHKGRRICYQYHYIPRPTRYFGSSFTLSANQSTMVNIKEDLIGTELKLDLFLVLRIPPGMCEHRTQATPYFSDS